MINPAGRENESLPASFSSVCFGPCLKKKSKLITGKLAEG
jgi:hypothetical protein